MIAAAEVAFRVGDLPIAITGWGWFLVLIWFMGRK